MEQNDCVCWEETTFVTWSNAKHFQHYYSSTANKRWADYSEGALQLGEITFVTTQVQTANWNEATKVRHVLSTQLDNSSPDDTQPSPP